MIIMCEGHLQTSHALELVLVHSTGWSLRDASVLQCLVCCTFIGNILISFPAFHFEPKQISIQHANGKLCEQTPQRIYKFETCFRNEMTRGIEFKTSETNEKQW